MWNIALPEEQLVPLKEQPQLTIKYIELRNTIA
jgi:hypothetical protein